MAGIAPQDAAQHRSASRSDAGDPEVISGRVVTGDAVFSPCLAWRYRLSRRWAGGDGRSALWVMLNPSTADAVRVDPTVRRAVAFSMQWGYSAMQVGNCFALRATSPKHLYAHGDPVGPDNDAHLAAMMAESALMVLAWGNHAAHGDRFRRVAELLRPHRDRCVALAVTAGGQPGHPLYLPGTAAPQPAGALVERLLG